MLVKWMVIRPRPRLVWLMSTMVPSADFRSRSNAAICSVFEDLRRGMALRMDSSSWAASATAWATRASVSRTLQPSWRMRWTKTICSRSEPKLSKAFACPALISSR